MNRVCIMSAIISFAISAAAGPVFIPLLRRIKCGQTVRDDGPRTHLKKTGTPTMGGILILAGVAAASLLYARGVKEAEAVLFLTFGFGLIGLLDDFLKVVCKCSTGLKAWQKFACQILVTGSFFYYLRFYTDVDLAMMIPFMQGRHLDLGKWSIPFLFPVVLGTANGVNFTDGLDGLAASVTLMVTVFFTAAAIGFGSGIAPVGCAVAGSLMGFLLFNVYPASVFMGDTGSLALGGFVAASACVLGMPLFIALAGFIYLAEVLSVMLQVAWFRASGGRRIFRMAPLHHHFELCGCPETRIVAAFAIVTAILCLIGLLAI